MDIIAALRERVVEVVTGGDDVNSSSRDAGVLTERLQDLDYFKLHPSLTIIYLLVMSVSTLFGLVGNILVISAVFAHPKLRTKANIFIVNLAIADSNVAYVVQVFSIVGLTAGYGWFMDKSWLCHAIATICLISCSCSLWNMACIAVNRFICICKRDLYQKLFTWRGSILIAMSLWVICGLLEMPNYFGWGGHTFDPKTMACSYDRTANYTYTLFFVLVAIGPPLVVVCCCYINIFLKVQASRKLVQSTGAISSTNDRAGGWTRSELQLAKTLFIIFVVFLCCWSPYAVVVLIDYDDRWPKIVYVVVIQLAHTNSSLNSIIYAANNKDFRDGYIRVLCFWRKDLKFMEKPSHVTKPPKGAKTVKEERSSEGSSLSAGTRPTSQISVVSSAVSSNAV